MLESRPVSKIVLPMIVAPDPWTITPESPVRPITLFRIRQRVSPGFDELIPRSTSVNTLRRTSMFRAPRPVPEPTPSSVPRTRNPSKLSQETWYT